MQFTGPIFRIALAAALAATVSTAQINPSAHKKSSATVKPASNPAQVTYSGEQLTVVANNNSLADVLAEIRNVTKSRIEGVQPGPGDRISGEFGPDTPRAVVGALLASSHYNFILVSPPGNPGSLQRIVLSEPAPEPVAQAAPIPRPAPLARPSEPPQPSAEADRVADNDARSDARSDAKNDGQKTEPAIAEKVNPDVTSEVAPGDEPKQKRDLPASTESNRTSADEQPAAPPTVEICGVTYNALQLADLKVPDHCGKQAQQPNPTSGSK